MHHRIIFHRNTYISVSGKNYGARRLDAKNIRDELMLISLLNDYVRLQLVLPWHIIVFIFFLSLQRNKILRIYSYNLFLQSLTREQEICVKLWNLHTMEIQFCCSFSSDIPHLLELIHILHQIRRISRDPRVSFHRYIPQPRARVIKISTF